MFVTEVYVFIYNVYTYIRYVLAMKHCTPITHTNARTDIAMKLAQSFPLFLHPL